MYLQVSGCVVCILMIHIQLTLMGQPQIHQTPEEWALAARGYHAKYYER